ncbi:MAG: hypothetical protein SW833_08535 [Cyanobacteriota bacterium]|nr:hypothetical protein [Cyanobacteriota bacterium]
MKKRDREALEVRHRAALEVRHRRSGSPKRSETMPHRKPSISVKTLWTIPIVATLFASDPAVSQMIEGPIDWNSVPWPTGQRSNSYNVGCPGNQNVVNIEFSGDVASSVSGIPLPSLLNIGPDGPSLSTAMDAKNANRETRISITFSPGVILASLRIHDIDANDLEQRNPSRDGRVWVDEVEITANGGAVIPPITTDLSTAGIPAIPPPPYEMSLTPNPLPFRNQPQTNPDNPIDGGVSAVVVNSNFPAGNVATGIGDGTNNTGEGTITADFGTNLINSIEIIYRNSSISPATNSEIAQQAISVGNLNFANPCIGVAKQVSGPVNEIPLNSGIYQIPYTIVVENEGNVPMSGVQVTEDFATQFGLTLGGNPLLPGQYRIIAPPAASGTLSANPNFNGSTDINLLNPANPAGNSLTGGQRETITLSIEVRPDPPPTAQEPAVLNNQVTASGTYTTPNGVPITTTDISTNGTDPDPDNNGDPSGPGNDIPTRVPLPEGASIPGIIGVAKQAGTPVPVAGQAGVFDITYTIVVENSGTEDLRNVQIEENLTATTLPGGGNSSIWSSLTHTPSQNPAVGQYTIVPSPTTAPPLTINPSFTGSGANTGLLDPASSSLVVDRVGTVTFTARVHPDPASLPGNLDNQVTASGTDPQGDTVTDRSVDGTNPDDNGNFDPRDDESSTSVSLTSGPPPIPPRIGVAKGVGLPTEVSSGIFDVPYTIRVQNYGNVDLANVQVEENFAAAVVPPGTPDPAWSSLTYTTNLSPSPGQYTVAPMGAPNATGSLTGNPTFTGSASGSINLLDAANSTLAVGQSELINFVVRIAPVNVPVTLNNQVRASGVDPNNPNEPVNDTSVNDANTPGNPNPDPNNDNDPTDNTTPTPVQLPPTLTPRIGVGKSASNATDATPNDPNDGLFDVNYAILVQNAGNVDLNNVQLTEDFASQFGLSYTPGAPGVGQYTLLAPPATTAPLTANPSFTGSGSNTSLLDAASSSLAIGQQQTLTVGVRVNIDPTMPFILDNQVTARGSSGGQTVTDNSNDGTNGPDPNNPDPSTNGDGDPRDDNTPTRVSLPLGRFIPRIGTAKAVDTNNIVDLGNGIFNIPYTIIVENAGTDNLNDVQVTENFEEPAPFGFGLTYTSGTPVPGQYTVIGSPTTSSPLRANPSFTGSGTNTGLLDAANSRLSIGERREVNFTVQVNPASIPVNLNNQVEASATGQRARDANGRPIRTTDLSDDGLNTSDDANLNPNDDQAPTLVTLPPIGMGTGGDFVLVKRITGVTRDGQALPGADFSRFVDDPSDGNDNQLNTTPLKPVGQINVEGLQSGDEVEYTIYYLAGGRQLVTNARICDLVPERTTFIPNSFGGESGILLRQGTAETAQTNAGDGDRAQFFSPLAPVDSAIPPCPANTANPNGAVFTTLGNIPNTGPNQTGFLRFRVRVD